MLNTNNSTVEPRRTRNGLSPLGWLLSVAVLAAGALGFSALDNASANAVPEGRHAMQANWLAGDMIEQMRTASQGTRVERAGEYARVSPAQRCDGTLASDAANDLRCWLDAIATTLPPPQDGSAAGSIRRDGNLFTLTIRWADPQRTLTDGRLATLPMSWAVEL